MRRGRQWQGDVIGRAAEWTANRMGSAQFLLGMTVFITAWFIVNGLREFDPDFFVLNLLFSTMSSYAAPLILLAQNRAGARDRTAIEHDRAINRQSRNDMDYLSVQIRQLRVSLDDLPTRRAVRDDIGALGDELRASPALRRLIAGQRAPQPPASGQRAAGRAPTTSSSLFQNST
ncbi:MAG: DUF1003 domain-containing protein [Propionibacteriaceae bacterium]|nr:DUF1003 domain-containing protein [Propionibacteriaceae bacterium]